MSVCSCWSGLALIVGLLTVSGAVVATPETLASDVRALMNVWHIPSTMEPPTVTMRNPVEPSAGESPVYIYCGGYPQGTIWTGQIIYHKAGTPYWSSAGFVWDSNNGSNEYFVAALDNVYNAGDQIDYILELHGDPGVYDVTYVYGDDAASYTSANSNDAYNNPFSFVVQTPAVVDVPTVGGAGICVLLLALSGLLLGARISRQ